MHRDAIIFGKYIINYLKIITTDASHSIFCRITNLNPKPLVFLVWSDAYLRDIRQLLSLCHQLPPRRTKQLPSGFTSIE